jgi:hypothetical protein
VSAPGLIPKPGVQQHKVVVNLSNGQTVRGYFRTEEVSDLNTLLENVGRSFPDVMTIYLEQDGSVMQIELISIKAVFFVREFEGDSHREGIRYYTRGPEVGALWVEIEFQDGELLEGTIHNSVHHLVENGFFLHPSDVGSNNLLIYVSKRSIVNYRVLGVRTIANG